MREYNISFSRALAGFNRQEVSAVTMELQKKIVNLERDNEEISVRASHYKSKSKALSLRVKKLTDERAQESLQVTAIMSSAIKTVKNSEFEAHRKVQKPLDKSHFEAQRIVESARREADEIRQKAQRDCNSACGALDALFDYIQIIRDNNESYIQNTSAQLCAVEAMLTRAKEEVTQPDPVAHTFTEMTENSAELVHIKSQFFEDFVQNIKLAE